VDVSLFVRQEAAGRPAVQAVRMVLHQEVRNRREELVWEK
jgi:hypothetical protein